VPTAPAAPQHIPTGFGLGQRPRYPPWMAQRTVTVVLAALALAACSREPATRPNPGVLDVERLAKAATAYFEKTGHFLAGTTSRTPDCCNEDSHRCTDPGVWTGLWEQLPFRIDDGHVEQYSYEGTADGFVANVRQDYDCDGMVVDITLTGSVDGNGKVVVTRLKTGQD